MVVVFDVTGCCYACVDCGEHLVPRDVEVVFGRGMAEWSSRGRCCFCVVELVVIDVVFVVCVVVVIVLSMVIICGSLVVLLPRAWSVAGCKMVLVLLFCCHSYDVNVVWMFVDVLGSKGARCGIRMH